MPRLLKLTIDDRDGGVLSFPAFSRIVSVGFQKRRDGLHPTLPVLPVKNTPVRDETLPRDIVPGDDDDVSIHFTVELRDNRTDSTEKRNVEVNAGPDAERDVREHYAKRGFSIISMIQVQTASSAAICAAAQADVPTKAQPPVVAVWFESPDVSALGADEATWPKVDVAAIIVPTGAAAPSDAVFIGTLSRPQSRNSAFDAVFHIYIERSRFLLYR